MSAGRLLLALATLLSSACGTGSGTTSPNDGTLSDTASKAMVRADSSDVAAANAVAQAVLLNRTPEQLDESTVQSMLDSLASPLASTRKLQAKAITRIWGRCDGAIAEAVGLTATEYVSEHPVEFFALFPHEITDHEMPIWADMIAQELLTDAEDDPSGAIDALAAQLRATCRFMGSPRDAEVERLRSQVSTRITELTSSI